MGRTYPAEINRILYKPGGPIGRLCQSVAVDIADQARILAEQTYGKDPRDKPRTGDLAKSYRIQIVQGTNTFIVRNPKKYAAAMEFGARPHFIKARRVEYLQFRDRQGNPRRTKIVFHPGSLPHNTLRKARDMVVIRRFGTIKSY